MGSSEILVASCPLSCFYRSSIPTRHIFSMAMPFPSLSLFDSLQFTLGVNAASLFNRAKSRYGDYFQFSVYGTPVFCITNPFAISTLEKQLAWNTAHKMPVTSNSTGPFLQEINPGFLLFTDLSHHKNRKSMINRYFSRVDNDSYIQQLISDYHNILPSLRAMPSFDLGNAMFSRLMVNLLSTHFYSIGLDSDEIARLDNYLKTALRIFRLSLAYPAPLFRSRLSPFLFGFHKERELVRAHLQSRLSAHPVCPLRSNYVSAFRENYMNPDQPVSCSSSVLTDDALGLFLAGIDTVMASLDLILKIVAIFPAVREKIRRESLEFFGDRQHCDPRQLKYARLVVLEVLRLYPVFPHLFKTVMEESVVDGYLLPAKSFVYIQLSSIHRDPRWFADPLMFNPDRWTSYDFSSDSTNTFLPFGLGAHHCPGADLAILELSVLISLLLADFDVRDQNPLQEGDLCSIPLLFNGLSVRPRKRAFLTPL